MCGGGGKGELFTNDPFLLCNCMAVRVEHSLSEGSFVSCEVLPQMLI